MRKEIVEEIIGANRVAMANKLLENGGSEEVADRIAVGRETIEDVEEYNSLAGSNKKE